MGQPAVYSKCVSVGWNLQQRMPTMDMVCGNDVCVCCQCGGFPSPATKFELFRVDLTVGARYLANDMQFFVISPLFLFLYNAWPAGGVTAAVLAIAGCIGSVTNQVCVAVSVWMCVRVSASASVSASAALTSGCAVCVCASLAHVGVCKAVRYDAYSLADFSGQLHFGGNTDIYIRPWNRMGAYFCGMLGAMFWLRYKVALMASGRRHILSLARPVVVRTVAFVVALYVLLSLFYGKEV